MNHSVWDLKEQGIKEGSIVDSALNKPIDLSDLWVIQSINVATGEITLARFHPAHAWLRSGEFLISRSAETKTVTLGSNPSRGGRDEF